MKKLTQKLVLSVITMALVVVALGTSTFAWFTLTNKATISAFQAQVTAGEGIEITLGDWDNVNLEYDAPTATTVWYTVLPESVIESYISNMYTAFRLDNVTSSDGEVMKNEAGTTLSTSSVAPYLEFKLYFRSSAEKTIVWNYASLGGTKETWTVNVPTFLDSDNATSRALNTTKEVAAWTGARVSVEGTTATFIYQEPTGTVNGVYNTVTEVESFDLGLFDHDNDGGTTPEVYGVGYGAAAPYGAAAYGVAAGKETTYGTTMPTVAETSVRTATDAVMTLTLNGAYYTGDVMVRVWIEGFDADTFDAIFDTELSVQIGFTVAA